jgi:biopolymer transport protein ExbD
MAFLNPGAAGRGVPRAEINMIPLIDVMLVLLVIFMVTAPLLTHAVKLDLPQASALPKKEARKVDISIAADGQRYWDGHAVTLDDIEARLAELGRQHPETELHLYADKAARYEVVAELMSSASRAGLQRIGFVTQPGKAS